MEMLAFRHLGVFCAHASSVVSSQVKDSLFKNPAVGALLLNAGNIPVDRKNKNNQSLFRGTFEGVHQFVLYFSSFCCVELFIYAERWHSQYWL